MARPSDLLWSDMRMCLESGDPAALAGLEATLEQRILHPALRSAVDAQLQWARGGGPRALKRLEATRKERRLGPHERLVIGLMWLECGRTEAAVKELEAVRQIGVPDRRIELGLAKVAMDRGDLAAARYVLDALLHRDPEAWQARLLLGTVATKQDDLHTALECFMALTQQVPELEPGWTHAASILCHLGKPEQAGHVLLEAAKVNPAFVGAQLGLVDVLESTGRQDQAIALLAALAERTEDPRLLMDLVERLLIVDRVDEAARALQPILESAKDAPRLHYQLGLIADRQDEVSPARAIVCFRRALQLDPTYEPALQALQILGEAAPKPQGASV